MQDGINKINIKDVRLMKVEVSEKDMTAGHKLLGKIIPSSP